MKPASRLSLEEIDTLLAFVRKHWPELAYYERGVVTLALNRIEAIAEKEGVSAITPERLSGQREIVEDYLLPFLEAERIRALVAAQPQNAPVCEAHPPPLSHLGRLGVGRVLPACRLLSAPRPVPRRTRGRDRSARRRPPHPLCDHPPRR